MQKSLRHIETSPYKTSCIASNTFVLGDKMFYNLSALNLPVPCLCSASLHCYRVSALIPSLTKQPSRSLTYYSVKKAKRKTVKSVTDRFMRLHCGLWIRRKVQVFYCLLHIKNDVSNLTSCSRLAGWIQKETVEEETCQTKAPEGACIL